ncbi:hypothetical protein AVEN_45988-1 [Araneus ventricosus]|uniref:Uncharacterized protein n=1 Tax=Araneus ventricosus TaxID=182803 RepID=A0A4Y2FA72_ARAVE|nr:hypothetical protein AVEN_45988-1 [Araneus ventricosus]
MAIFYVPFPRDTNENGSKSLQTSVRVGNFLLESTRMTGSSIALQNDLVSRTRRNPPTKTEGQGSLYRRAS